MSSKRAAATIASAIAASAVSLVVLSAIADLILPKGSDLVPSVPGSLFLVLYAVAGLMPVAIALGMVLYWHRRGPVRDR